MTTASGDAYFYACDGNGNVVQLVASAGAGVAAEYLYEAFGRVLAATGPTADENPMRFSTKHRDAESGLLYFGYRELSPWFGRWISRDPAEELSAPNIYAYCLGSPLIRFDALGQSSAPTTRDVRLADWVPGSDIEGDLRWLGLGVSRSGSRTSYEACRASGPDRMTCGYAFAWRFHCDACDTYIVQTVKKEETYFAQDGRKLWGPVAREETPFVEAFAINVDGWSVDVDAHWEVGTVPKRVPDIGSSNGRETLARGIATRHCVETTLVACCGTHRGFTPDQFEWPGHHSKWIGEKELAMVDCTGPQRKVTVRFCYDVWGRSDYILLDMTGSEEAKQ
jgi:RHS repeat-associated protein